jgi:hypothetical protein
MKNLDLIIGGVQKCGTTALFEYLARHPDFLAPSIKELHFFDNETDVDWSKPDYEPYHRLFRNNDGTKIWFEATPIYIFWPQSLERIVAYRPDIKLIFLFRDPVQRAWSHWCMEYARDAESLDFATAIRSGRQRMGGSAPNAPLRRTFSYVERGFYSGQVKRILSFFPRQNVLFLSSEQLRTNPRQTLERVTRFLNVPELHNFSIIDANVQAPFPYPCEFTEEDRNFLQEVYARDVESFGSLSGVDVSGWLSGPAP